MTKWVQLKDGVAFAIVESPYFIENSIALEDNVSWDNVKAKKYTNGQWVEAPLTYFVIESKDGVVQRVNSTVFSSDVTGDIVPFNCEPGWIKNEDGSYSAPVVSEPTE
jgi:hypothetical protein